MRKQTFHSFNDLDASRFAQKTEEERYAPARPNAERKKHAAQLPGTEDESALFLDAVSGSLDVSMKHTPAKPAEEPPSRKERKAKLRAALPDAAPPVSTGPPVPCEKPGPVSPEDDSLFADAMSGVAPIRARGRDLAPLARPAAAQPPRVDMGELVLGKLEFSLEYTEEFVQGHVLGLDPVIMEKLKAGAYSPEAHVDLHGRNMEQAYATLVEFIKHTYQNGKRHLIVVTGRGKNSPGGMPVLRERVQLWFTRDPFKRVILGFCTAKPGDGGPGALYLLLRKRKKHQGKIVWNTFPSEEDLLL